MEHSIFFAKFIGYYLIIASGAMMVNRRGFHTLLLDDAKSNARIIYSGILSLIFGLVVVLMHNVWVWGWPVIITLLGYLTVIKGIVRIYLTSLCGKYERKFAHRTQYNTFAFIAMVIGGILLVCGYLEL